MQPTECEWRRCVAKLMPLGISAALDATLRERRLYRYTGHKMGTRLREPRILASSLRRARVHATKGQSYCPALHSTLRIVLFRAMMRQTPTLSITWGNIQLVKGRDREREIIRLVQKNCLARMWLCAPKQRCLKRMAPPAWEWEQLKYPLLSCLIGLSFQLFTERHILLSALNRAPNWGLWTNDVLRHLLFVSRWQQLTKISIFRKRRERMAADRELCRNWSWKRRWR